MNILRKILPDHPICRCMMNTLYDRWTFTVCVLHCCSFGRSKLQERSTKTKFLLTIVIKFEANYLRDSAIERARRSLSVAMFRSLHVHTFPHARRLCGFCTQRNGKLPVRFQVYMVMHSWLVAKPQREAYHDRYMQCMLDYMI